MQVKKAESIENTLGSDLSLDSKLEPNYFRQINFGLLNAEQQEYTLQLLEASAEKNGEGFLRLNLSSCDVIRHDRLIRLLEKMSNLKVLDIRECPQLGVILIYEVFGYQLNDQLLCPHLKRIVLTVNGKDEELILNVGLLERQSLMRWSQEWYKDFQRTRNEVSRMQSDQHASVQIQVSETLGRLGVRNLEHRTNLLNKVKDQDSSVRAQAMEALGRLGYSDPEICESILNAIRDPEWFVRMQAVESLGHLKYWNSTIREELIACLKGRDLRLQAVKSLGQMGHWDPDIRIGLLNGLRDQKESVRAQAARALGRLGHWDPDIQACVLTALSDPHEIVRVRAANAIGLLGHWDDDVQSGLLARLKDPYATVQVQVMVSLEWLGHGNPEVIPGLLGMLSDNDRSIRLRAVRDLGRLKQWDPEIASGFLGVLKDREGAVRLKAIKALRWLGHTDAEIRTGLLSALNDQYPAIRAEAVKALGRCFQPSSLIDYLREEIRTFPSIDQLPLNDIEQNKILKRIFFFVTDPRTQRALPCVSRKWRDLYSEFREDKRLEAPPKLQSTIDPSMVDAQKFYDTSNSCFEMKF